MHKYMNKQNNNKSSNNVVPKCAHQKMRTKARCTENPEEFPVFLRPKLKTAIGRAPTVPTELRRERETQREGGGERQRERERERESETERERESEKKGVRPRFEKAQQPMDSHILSGNRGQAPPHPKEITTAHPIHPPKKKVRSIITRVEPTDPGLYL